MTMDPIMLEILRTSILISDELSPTPVLSLTSSSAHESQGKSSFLSAKIGMTNITITI